MSPWTRLSCELRDTLFGKYGEDAEQLIFSAQHGRSASEPLAMRYDLTVPLARVVAQHESALSLPFKRYHIAPVFRGERPQRGRYREFYQCDADIVGVAGVMADAEIVIMMQQILRRLGFPQFVIKIKSPQAVEGYRRILWRGGGAAARPVSQRRQVRQNRPRRACKRNWRSAASIHGSHQPHDELDAGESAGRGQP